MILKIRFGIGDHLINLLLYYYYYCYYLMNLRDDYFTLCQLQVALFIYSISSRLGHILFMILSSQENRKT